MVKAESTNQRARNAPVKAYFVNHLRTFIGSLGFLWRHALSSIMTMAVIAIALALPSGMYVMLNNLNQVSVGWDDSAQISLFLKTDVSDKQAESLIKKLKLHEDIDKVALIHRDRALEEFQRVSGFSDAIEALGENPLPHVLAVQPRVDPQRPDKMNHLVTELGKLNQVEIAQLDLQWVKRLYAMLEIAHRGIWLISSLLGLAVLLVVGNTIRLDIQNRREEIEVTKLIGATNAFIRRPFLYTGLWYGLSGGILAWLLTSLSLFMIDDSVARLAVLYSSEFELNGLSGTETLFLIGLSSTLGLGGSWLAVSRHLHEIEPS